MAMTRGGGGGRLASLDRAMYESLRQPPLDSRPGDSIHGGFFLTQHRDAIDGNHGVDPFLNFPGSTTMHLPAVSDPSSSSSGGSAGNNNFVFDGSAVGVAGEAPSILSFSGAFGTSSSMLSFEQLALAHTSSGGGCNELDDQDDYAAVYGLGSGAMSNDALDQPAAGSHSGSVHGATTKVDSGRHQQGEEQFEWLYPGDGFGKEQEGRDVEGAGTSHKRLHAGGEAGHGNKKNGGAGAHKKQKTSTSKPSSSKDPQSLAAKNRRERISERLKVLQELVPNGTKVDLVTMLEKAITYVKFLQLQVKVLATDELWPSQGGKAPEIGQVKEAIEAILSSHRDRT